MEKEDEETGRNNKKNKKGGDALECSLPWLMQGLGLSLVWLEPAHALHLSFAALACSSFGVHFPWLE